jgi:predicted RNA-binding Zn ribbon-like protein
MTDWVLDGGRVSLDLLNTVRDRTSGGRETLRGPADLAAWLRDTGLPADAVEPGEDDLSAARRLRAAIDTLLFPAGGTASAAAAAVAVVNATAARAAGGPRLALDGDGRPVAIPPQASVPAALARIAADTIALVGGEERLRVCAAGDCGIRFVDRSPSGNRQWCSMRRCGNRTKARRHYARTTA